MCGYCPEQAELQFDEAACLLPSLAFFHGKPSYSKGKLDTFPFMIKSVSEGLGYAQLVTLTSNASVLPIPGNDNRVTCYYEHPLLRLPYDIMITL